MLTKGYANLKITFQQRYANLITQSEYLDPPSVSIHTVCSSSREISVRKRWFCLLVFKQCGPRTANRFLATQTAVRPEERFPSGAENRPKNWTFRLIQITL